MLLFIVMMPVVMPPVFYALSGLLFCKHALVIKHSKLIDVNIISLSSHATPYISPLLQFDFCLRENMVKMDARLKVSLCGRFVVIPVAFCQLLKDMLFSYSSLFLSLQHLLHLHQRHSNGDDSLAGKA